MAPAVDVDPLKLSSAGWGVIFAPSISSEVENALQPLLKRRAQAAGVHYRLYWPSPRATASKEDFLTSCCARQGPANPKSGSLPYYLLIVGSPKEIPFRFQYDLDVQYAVGRIHFTNKDGTEDVEAYRSYARNVVETEEAAEAGSTALPPRQITLFGVSQDSATMRSEQDLVQPLAEVLTEDRPDWLLKLVTVREANKTRLSRLLGGNETPSILFTASHGANYPLKDEFQLSNQGALLCQDWPGWCYPILPEHYFSSEDVSEEADLRGLIFFHFACYSGGTPDVSSFVNYSWSPARTVAPVPFVSKLAQRLLSHPRGALAVVGHVDKAWSTTFSWSDSAQVDLYENTLKRLLDGYPIGFAMEFFNQRYAELAVELSNHYDDLNQLIELDDDQFVRAFRARSDVRNFVVLGDPAVKAAFRVEG